MSMLGGSRLWGTIAAALVALWVGLLVGRRRGGYASGVDKGALLDAMREVRDQSAPRSREARVALGYNVCLDAVVNAFELFREAGVKSPAAGRDVADIASLEDLAATFLLHFTKSAAGERAVSNLETFAALERSLYRAKHRMSLGGNAAIMAVVLARDFGFEHVLLGGQVGPLVEELLPESVLTVRHESGQAAYGEKQFNVRQDEVHIIMEYAKGASWGGSAKTSRANRFIVSHDVSNAVLAPLEPLNDFVREADQPYDLLVAAGLHMLDAMDVDFRQERLASITQSLASVPAETRVHFELASVGDERLMQDLASEVLPLVDSLGLNEQEIGSLFDAMNLRQAGGEDVDLALVTSTVPDIATVAKVMELVLREQGRQRRRKNLSRIHFHSFSYHIIAQTEGAPWPNMAQAVAAGSVKASERACNRTTLGSVDLSIQLPGNVLVAPGETRSLSPGSPLAEWASADGNMRFVLAPVLACNEPVQTVGLGDSISASALAYQV